MRIILVGDFYTFSGCLGMSYRAAFESLGHEVTLFDVRSSLNRYTRFGRFGKVLGNYFTVDAWLLKMNRELVALCRRLQPGAVIVIGANEIKAGALAQIKTSARSRLAFVWMDPLQNLAERTIQGLPLYDLVANYSRDAIEPLHQLGAKKVEWIPFAGDPHLYTKAESHHASKFACDVSFVGNWRPEREAILDRIAAMPEVSLKVWGGQDWQRYCRSQAVKRAWQKEAVYTSQFAAAVRASKININVIDDTNYPAANMRYFEIPYVGGLQLCSPCPELDSDFRHGETIFYFNDQTELAPLIKSLLPNDALRQRVSAAAQAKVISNHTYTHRANQIMDSLNG